MDFDLNLLKVLVAVAEAGSVSGAAQALGMTQPGTSTALGRLRRAVDDPLFVRTSQGMEATPRAVALLTDTRELLARVHSGIAGAGPFDPATTTTTFRVALSDIGEMCLLPQIITCLRLAAPQASIESKTLPLSGIQDALEDGSVDLALGYVPELTGRALYQQRLFNHHFCCLVRAGHPFKEDAIPLADYLAMDHVVVHTPVRSQEMIDRQIERLGGQRRVVLHTTHFMSLPAIIATTDLVATVPAAVGSLLVESGLLRSLTPPVQSPQFPVRQHWHRRFHRDPRNRWLRQLIQQAFAEGWQLPLPADQRNG